MTCDAAIRLDTLEVRCEEPADHPGTGHAGTLRDLAYPGSATRVEWADDDRRSYRGPYPGPCPSVGCPLPAGHPRRHA